MSVTPRLFITGGTGFIGSQLALQAARTGHSVTVASPINNDAERFRCDLLARAGISVVEATLDDTARLRDALVGHDAIIHLAAAQHEAEAPESHFHKVNVDGTRALLQLATRVGVRRVVHGSTIGVYGDGGRGVLDELSPLAPDNPYGRTKAAGEAVAREFASRLDIVIVRISETYGPADLRLLKLFKAIKRGRYVTLGSGLNERQLIYVEDLCRALLAAAQAPAAVGQTMILAGSERLTTDAMVASICTALGKPGARASRAAVAVRHCGPGVRDGDAAARPQAAAAPPATRFLSQELSLLDGARRASARLPPAGAVRDRRAAHRRLVSRSGPA